MEKKFTRSYCINRCKTVLIILMMINCLCAAAVTGVLPKGIKVEKWDNKATDQTITFGAIPAKTYTDIDFDAGATASSGLTVMYVSNNAAVATIIANKIHIVGPGTALITASQDGDATYNRATRVSQTLTVSKSNLTVTASSQTRTYGIANSPITLTFTGFKAGESINQLPGKPSAATTATARSNVGTYSVNISGGVSNNYNFAYVAGSVTVNKAILAITAVAKTKAYGAAVPALTVTYTGFLVGDNAGKLSTQATISTTATVNSPAGNYPITVTGAAALNYSINQVNANLTVLKGNLVFTAAAKTKVYTAANPALTYTVRGFVLGQTEAVLTTPVVLSTTAVQTSPAGAYPIALSGAATANYNITYIQSFLTVTKAVLRISSDAKTKVYGQMNPVLSISYAGFVNGENTSVLTAQPTVSTTATQNSPVGAYNINIGGAAVANYNITYVIGKLTITKATLNIVANNQTRVYGSPNPALTATYTGFVNGDTEANLTTKPTIATTATAFTNAGVVAITVKNGLSANYNLVYGNGALTITKATLTIKADDATRVYGNNFPTFTATYSGFVNGQTENNLSRKPSLTAPVSVRSPAGTYVITPINATAGNYNIIYQTGVLTIGKRTLTIVAANKSRGYGAANPALTVFYTGLVNNDRAPAILTGTPILTTTANTASELGNYPIEISGTVTAQNYDIAFANGIINVGKAVIKITVVNKNKTYGQPNPALTLTYTGFVNGDNISVITTLPQAPTTTATTTSPTGNYPITTTGGAVADKYNFTYVQGRLGINRANLNIIFDNKSKVYGQPNPVVTYRLTGFINGDTEASQPFIVNPQIITAPANSPAEIYQIRSIGGFTQNYNLRSVNGFFTVTKANLLISAVDASRGYGAADPAFTATYTGLVNGDTEANLTTMPTFTTDATPTSGRGAYAINISGAVSPNYNITYASAVLTITKGRLIVKAADQARDYGSANPAFPIAYDGLLNGDTEGSFTTPATAVANVNAGTVAGTYLIVPSGFNDERYEPEYVNGTLTINKANITVAAQNDSRIYGEENPAFTATYTGFVNGETDAVLTTRASGATVATTASAVGNYTINFTGALAANYNFIYNQGTLSVIPASLTITANNASRDYGAADPAYTSTYSGFVNNDTEASLITAPIYTTTATVLSGIGTYPLNVGGAVSNNYNIAYSAGNLTVNRAQLNVKADDKNKTYGNANPAFTVNYTGFVNGETSTILTSQANASVSSVINASTLPGNYTITPTGGSADNYQLSYNTGTFSIDKAILTVNAGNAARAFGDANPLFTVAYSGFVLGDTQAGLATQPTATTVAVLNSPVGDYPIVPAGGASDKYAFNYVNGTLSVSKAVLVITANAVSRAYGAADPVFTSTYRGFINGDTEASMNALPQYTTNATATSGIGQYIVTPFGAVNNNYAITYNTGALTITKAQLIAKADDKTKTYGEANPAFTVNYIGFANGDTEAVLTSPASAFIAAGINASTIPGSYTVTATGGSAANYDLSYSTGILTIGKAALTVTADNASRIYGAANPLFGISYTGFIGTDTQAGLITQPTAISTASINSAVGNYAIVPAGGVSDRYSFVYNNGTLSITKAALTITAEKKAKIYGSANPVFTAVYSGFINGDTETSITTKPTFNTIATATSATGAYAIIPAGAISNNYTIVYNNGTLTVDKAQLTVTAADKLKAYGVANPPFTVNYSGFVNGDTETVLTAPSTASSIATAATGAGTYTITPTGGLAANYNLVYANGTLTVNKVPLSITANNATRLFNTPNPIFTVVYAGFVNGDTENNLTAKPEVTTTAIAESPVGTYAIIPTAATSANYNFTYVNGVLNITPNTAPITISFVPSKTFGDADFDPIISNTANEPMIYTSSNAAVATIINGKIHIVGAGITTVTASFPVTSNYSSTPPVSQEFIVYKAQQSITFGTIPAITRGSSYTLGAVTSTSGLPVTLAVANLDIVSLQGQTLTGLQIGNTTVTASQPGNNNYLPASLVVQNVEVNNIEGEAEVVVHQAVSPNGDGINDVLFVEGITNHPDNRVTLINRNGLKVYEVLGYDNINRVFDGRSNVTQNLLQPGTYFYQIQYVVNGQGRNLTGYFVLKY